MRVTVGTIAVLGLAVAVAAAQPQPPGPRERAATLKPPQALAPGDLPPVARGVADEFPPPPTLSSSPVTRPNGSGRGPGIATGPAWLSGGTDSNVQPAASVSTKGDVRQLTPPRSTAMDEPPVQPKFLDRLKGTFTGDKPAAPKQLPPPVAQPQARPPEVPTAATPFRGTGSNGAPVYAGPPAYRWYGWGSVTPGANPLAPAGQYPKASANWYAITGATPGAFPVPVSNPTRTAPGTEPPNYGLAARTPGIPQPAASLPPVMYTERPEAPRPELPKFPVPDSKFLAGPAVGLGPAPAVPAFTPPPAPVSVPVMTAPPLPKPVVVVPPFVPPVLPIPKPDLVAAAPPVVPVLPPPVAPVPAVEPTKVPAPAPVLVTETKPMNVVPSPLPTSVTADPPPALPPAPPREELKWQQSAEPAAPGTWAPAPGATPLPTVAPAAAPAGHTGSAPTTPVARGQMPDKTPDPVATLIKQVCQNRADGVEVRWTGTKKLSVCFEVRTAVEAQKLVNDISRRTELTAYQIDFCVLVK